MGIVQLNVEIWDPKAKLEPVTGFGVKLHPPEDTPGGNPVTLSWTSESNRSSGVTVMGTAAVCVGATVADPPDSAKSLTRRRTVVF